MGTGWKHGPAAGRQDSGRALLLGDFLANSPTISVVSNFVPISSLRIRAMTAVKFTIAFTMAPLLQYTRLCD